MKDRNQKRFGDDDGYTLMELLVVLLILALLATIAVPQVFKQLGSAKSKTAMAQIEALGGSLDFYRMDMGSYPSQQEGLKALMEKPTGADAWMGPYLKKKSYMTDPWGREYQYKFPGTNGDYDLFTLGSDNAEGGEGEARDITSWE